ncbi:hypothetical protein OCS_02774 [Ophiocordyceps sinensis CO18]|uniref:Uncharacterized protein n=1 Tax=Ophiocordyceps sinensis (strain Co18 / CGMCC 3.14243) TaxID=911162 RepID=T5AFZ9_OPHSC|nr:hypothetical protein OCS_02774 [Ophiocordyceps sinensis CO18]
MKLNFVAMIVMALAGNGLAAPNKMEESSKAEQLAVGKASLAEMGLDSQAVTAAQCLKFLCCRGRKRDVQGTQIPEGSQREAQATCLVCFGLGVCDRSQTIHESAPQPRVSVNVDSIISNMNSFQENNISENNLWIPRNGHWYYYDGRGRYWEWMGDAPGDDFDFDQRFFPRVSHPNWRFGGRGRLHPGSRGYTFDFLS